jgi:hypothetical protein
LLEQELSRYQAVTFHRDFAFGSPGALLLFVDVFRNFFAEHGSVFEDAPALNGGEHNMKYYSLFQVYLKLYEVRHPLGHCL